MDKFKTLFGLGLILLFSGCLDVAGGNRIMLFDYNGADFNMISSGDGNVYSLGLLGDDNVWLIDLNTIGDVNAFALCINGDCILSWADLNTGGGGSGGFDGNVYSLGLLADNNVWLIDLNTVGDVNAFALCIKGDCILAWGDLNVGSFTDTNAWTEKWLDDRNALVNDLNLNANDIISVGKIGIGTVAPTFAIEINSGGGLSDWIKVVSNGGSNTFASEMDGASLDMMFTSGTPIPWRFIVGGTPSFDLVPYAGKINSHFYDEIRLYDDEDRDGNYGGFKAYSDLNASTIWVLPFSDGGYGQGVCTNGAGQLYFCDVNTGTGGGGGGFDGNIYSLGIMRKDTNSWLIDLNAGGKNGINFNDVNVIRLCFSDGNCLSSVPTFSNRVTGIYDGWGIDLNSNIGDVNITASTTDFDNRYLRLANFYDTNDQTAGYRNSLGVFLVDQNMGLKSVFNGKDANFTRFCFMGDGCISSWADVNSLDQNVFRYVLVAGGGKLYAKTTSMALPLAGTDINIYIAGNRVIFDYNGPTPKNDTNIWTAKALMADSNTVNINWKPSIDGDRSPAPDAGVNLGTDTNRWLSAWALGFHTGLLNEQQYEFASFESLRRCWNCSFQMQPDLNLSRVYKSTGYAPYLTEPEIKQSIDVNLAGNLLPLTQRNASFLQTETVVLGAKTALLTDLNVMGHWWTQQKYTYSGQISQPIRSGIHHTGAAMDRYNGVISTIATSLFVGCDYFSVVFDENLPHTKYSITLTGYQTEIIYGEPEPQVGYLQWDGVIESKSKTGFSGRINYSVFDSTGREIINPATGQDGRWCNYSTMLVDLMALIHIVPTLDYQITLYETS